MRAGFRATIDRELAHKWLIKSPICRVELHSHIVQLVQTDIMSDDAKSALQSQIKGSVLTPGDEGYEQSLKRWASNWVRRAAYVVFVESAEDISKTVLDQICSGKLI